jgi:hypothetical protein
VLRNFKFCSVNEIWVLESLKNIEYIICYEFSITDCAAGNPELQNWHVLEK